MNGDARPTSSAYWLIFGCEARGMEALTVELPDASGSPDGQRMLPVFGYGEEAKAFLDALRRDRSARGGSHATPVGSSGWRIRETTRGELVSLLCGACTGVHGVLLDPPPELEAGMRVDRHGTDGLLSGVLTKPWGVSAPATGLQEAWRARRQRNEKGTWMSTRRIKRSSRGAPARRLSEEGAR